MIRILAENIALFLLPTGAWLAYAALTGRARSTGAGVLDDAPLGLLISTGGALVLIMLVAFGTPSGGKPGQAYEPPIIVDGKIQPGHLK